MGLLELRGDLNSATFDAEECKSLGASLHSQYVEAEPFPSIVLEDFLDVSILKTLLADFPARDGKSYFDRDQERFKYQFHPWDVEGPALRNLLMQLNSRAFLKFLEALTGIKGLIPDPYFSGGGLHETLRGGHLSVHADFNVHKPLGLQRRLNFLLYLNEDWDPDYGGKLELWDKEMTACQRSIIPQIGRAVVFNTDMDSYHGHPDPLTCPPERSRRSIATYYYTAPEDGIRSLPERTTMFKARPQSGDKRDLKIGMQHFIQDWVPPRLQSFALRFQRFIPDR
jgi:hypothetical protein